MHLSASSADRYLCGHAIRQVKDCLAVRPLAQLRHQPCPRCQIVSFEGILTDLVLGRMDGDVFHEDRLRMITEDSRVRFLETVHPTARVTRRLCFPRLYPHTIAVKTMSEHGPQYQVIYVAHIF